MHARDDVDLLSKDDRGRTAPEMAKEYRDNLVTLNSDNVRERIQVLGDILKMFEEFSEKSFNVQG